MDITVTFLWRHVGSCNSMSRFMCVLKECFNEQLSQIWSSTFTREYGNGGFQGHKTRSWMYNF